MNLNHPHIPLNGAWRLRYGPQTGNFPKTPEELAQSNWPEIEAAVPGNVEMDLERAGLIEDPAHGARVHALRRHENHDWWYSRTFEFHGNPGETEAELVFEGLDCAATVWVNNGRAGESQNALVAQRFDVARLLRRGENTVTVRLASAVLEGRRHEIAPGEFAAGLNFEALHVRKPPHCYGWDIMPRLVSAGIWRGARLEFPPPTRWRAVYAATRSVDVAARAARLVVDWDFITDRDVDNLRVRLSWGRAGATPQRLFECACLNTHGRAEIELRDVDFWWPLGSGEPALHAFAAELVEDGACLATWRENIGVRTIELRRTELTGPDGAPGEFVFLVNGERVFVKGTNWVPLDALHSRDAAALPGVFPMLAELGCNMVRCWGGNVYEDHAFFDLCDRAGVMVWQDFAMGCAVYPQTPGFLAAIEREAESIVKKLRNHPSLALWAGNNEGDEAYEWAGMGGNPNREDRVTRGVLPAVTRRWDPLRPYLPSSPFRGEAFYAQGLPAALALPEQHLWGARDDFKGPTYTASAAHFASEIGYHGCPARESLEKFIPANELWPLGSPSWLVHAVQPHPRFHAYDHRVELMKKQVMVLFGETPGNLDDFIFASQSSQGEALKFFIEWFRAAKWRRTGILWWNLRDGWPVVSDAVVDYYNNKKRAFDYVRRAQAMVCAVCAEPRDGVHGLVVVNDLRAPAKGRLRAWQAGGPATLWEGAFEVPPNGRATVAALPQSAVPAMWLFEWALDNGATGLNHYLAGPRPVGLAWYRGVCGILSQHAAAAGGSAGK